MSLTMHIRCILPMVRDGFQFPKYCGGSLGLAGIALIPFDLNLDHHRNQFHKALSGQQMLPRAAAVMRSKQNKTESAEPFKHWRIKKASNNKIDTNTPETNEGKESWIWRRSTKNNDQIKRQRTNTATNDEHQQNKCERSHITQPTRLNTTKMGSSLDKMLSTSTGT